MLGQPAPVVDVLPDEEEGISLRDRLHPLPPKEPSGGGRLLMIDYARRLIKHPPAPLPGAVAEIHILQ